MNKKTKIGFIGQGWIGKNYADDFEKRGFDVVRYSLEEPYIKNKKAISYCDIAFIAVPTPTTPKGFDFSIVKESLKLVGKGKIAVIKSTILPGTTEKLQKDNKEIFVLNSPEFLSKSTAKYDVENPDCNVIGMPIDNDFYKKKALEVKSVLPKVPTIICSSREAEFIKYTHNIHGFVEIVYSNILYDLSEKLGLNWSVIKEFITHNKFMVERYADPVHGSNSKKSGRGAGGACFIKDFAAFHDFYKKNSKDKKTLSLLDKLKDKNIELLKLSDKDVDILKSVYGKDFIKK